MKKLFLLLLLPLGLASISYAGPYDDWPDDAICMWLEMKPTHEGYLGEAKKRGISCEGGVVKKAQPSEISSKVEPAKITLTKKISNEKILTSYQLAKESGVETVWYPVGFWLLDIGAYDDTHWIDVDGDGEKEIFAGVIKYFVDTHTHLNAPNSDFHFLKRNKQGKHNNGNIYDSYYPENSLIDGIGNGCIHPSKGVVNDFNLDGQMDIFVACSGYDAKPYPGEISKIVLSTPEGKYLIKDTKINGYTHSASSADFNGDGAADLILIDRSMQVWLNDGKGSFTRTEGYLPSSMANKIGYNQVALPDIDGDGDFDLFVGGNEYYLPTIGTNYVGAAKTYSFDKPKGSNKTAFYINQGDNKFSESSKIPIPAIKGKEIITDVVVTGDPGNKIAWIARTAGGPNSYYQGTFVQKYSFADQSSEIVYNSLTRKDFDQKRALRWPKRIISWNEDGKNLIGSKWQDEFFGFAFYADESDPLYLKHKTYTAIEPIEPESEPLKVGVDQIEGDIQNDSFHMSSTQSIRHGDYIANSSDIVLDGDSSEKFSIQPLDCDTSKSKDCDNNQQRLMMAEKDKITTEGTRLYEWSMYLPEDHKFPLGSQVTYNRFIGEDTCQSGSAATFVEYDDGIYLSLPIAGTFRRDDTHIIQSKDLIGMWHNFKLEVNWSKLPEKGYIKLILNDIFVHEYKGQTLRCDEASFTYGLLRSDINEGSFAKITPSSVYFDNVKISNIDDSNPSIFLEASLGKSTKKIEGNDLFDGRYRFTVFRHNEDEGAMMLGAGDIEIKNGELIIETENSYLSTGPKDLYDTFEGQISEDGEVTGSIELDILGGKDRSEVYSLNGSIDDRIWGESPKEDFFKVYLTLREK